jgi:hypothetical protein
MINNPEKLIVGEIYTDGTLLLMFVEYGKERTYQYRFYSITEIRTDWYGSSVLTNLFKV